MDILRVAGLYKNYGRIQAVKDLSFEVKKGSVFGLLGPNGSGKTTLLGCITGILQSNAGSFTWFDNMDFDEARKSIGALIETPNFYPYLTAWQNLQIVSRIKGLDDSFIESVLKEVGLFERRNTPFKTFSLGMKQRLAIASALLGKPEVLVLDEPTNGLDPQGINEIRQLIIRQKDSGKTIILASHLLNEVEKVCTDVVILKSGNLMAKGTVEQLLGQSNTVELASNNMAELHEILGKLLFVKSFRKDDSGVLIAELNEGIDAGELNQKLHKEGIVLRHLKSRKTDLESEFLKRIGDQ